VVREVEAPKHLLLTRTWKHRVDQRDDLGGRDEAVARDDLKDFLVALGDLEAGYFSRSALKARQALSDAHGGCH